MKNKKLDTEVILIYMFIFIFICVLSITHQIYKCTEKIIKNDKETMYRIGFDDGRKTVLDSLHYNNKLKNQ